MLNTDKINNVKERSSIEVINFWENLLAKH